MIFYLTIRTKHQVMNAFLPFLFIIYLLFPSINSPVYAQANDLELTVEVKDGKTKINDATINVFASTINITKDAKLTSGRTMGGKIKLTLELKKYYWIEVSKEGYVSQIVFFNSYAPEPDIAAGNAKSATVEVDLFRMIDGLVVSAIKDKPTIKLRYQKQDLIFDTDKDFEDKVKPKIDEIIKQLSKLLQEKFNGECQEGYKLADQKNYEEALLHYYKALEYYPGDKAALKKITDIEKKGVKKEQAFQKFKYMGDDSFNKKEYAAAIANFKKALVFNPGDTYVKGKITESQTKSQTAQNTQKEEVKKKLDIIVKFKGIVFKEDKKLKNVQIELFEENTKIKTAVTDENGSFSFRLEMNKNYFIEASKQGMVTEKITIKTQIPENKLNGDAWWSVAVSISMFDMVNGLNIIALNDPVRIIRYYPELDDFKNDKDYANKMDKIVDNLIAQADQIRKNPKLADKNILTQKQDPKNNTKEVVQNNTVDNSSQNQTDATENKEEADKTEANNVDKNNQPVLKNEDKRTSAQKIDSCLSHIKQLQASGEKKELAIALNDVAAMYYDNGDNNNALEYYGQSLKNKEELGDKQGTSVALMNLGVVNYNIFRYEDALKSFQKSLKIKQDLSDKPGESKILYRIGNVYYDKKEFEKAAEYYEKSLTLDKDLKNEKDIAASFNNLGVMFYELKNYEKSMEYYDKALQMNNSTGQEKEASISLNNIGNVNYDWHKFNEALTFYEQSLKIKEKIDYKKGVAISLFNIGNVYKELNKNDKALEYYNRSADVSKAQNYSDILYSVYSAMSDLYSVQKNCEKSLEYLKLSVPFKQYALNVGQHRPLSEMQVKYESDSFRNIEEISMLKEEVAKQKLITKELAERNELQLALKNTEIEKKDADIKMQKMQKYASFGGLFFLLLLALILFRGYKIKKKQNEIIKKKNDDLLFANHEIMEKNEELRQQKEEIIAQRDEIEAQKDIIIDQRDIATAQRDQITIQKQEITDSINYAEYIQRAMLKADASVIEAVPEHFIFFRPRNIVSGDFYWLGKKGESLIIAAVDCTGHGVPGGFMSMLGVAFLNEIVNKMPDKGSGTMLNAGEILNQLRDSVIKALHQTGKEGESKDGMDIALCVVNTQKSRLNFAGAFNPMYLVRNNELTEVRGDRMPIGIFIKEKTPFTNYEIPLTKNDQIYIFSDGFADQFGGTKEKKFSSESMKHAILENSVKPMEEQKTALEKVHNEWKGNIEQIDDILVIGFKV